MEKHPNHKEATSARSTAEAVTELERSATRHHSTKCPHKQHSLWGVELNWGRNAKSWRLPANIDETGRMHIYCSPEREL